MIPPRGPIEVTSNRIPHNAQVAEPMQANSDTVHSPARRRVLMLVENNSYPQDYRVRQEARVLTDAGYQVTVISPAQPGRRWRETIDGVYVYRYPALREASGFMGYLFEYGYSTVAMFILSLFVYLREGFDVIHTANPPDTLVLVAAVYKLLGKRFVYDHHDLVPELYDAIFPGRGNGLLLRAFRILGQ